MRPSLAVAALLSVVACAHPPLVETALVPSDQPLEVRLHQPIGGTLHYSLSEPAYVAIFAVSRGYGMRLVFPYYESQLDHRSHRGLNQETVHGGVGGSGYSTVSRYEWKASFGNPDAYYVIASKTPLPIDAFLQSSHVLRSVLGERTFRANNFTETWNALEALLVADLPQGHWASDAFVTWRDPFLSVAYSEPTFLHCHGGRSFYVPGLLSSGMCDPSPTTTVVATAPPPVTDPQVGVARREPPLEPRDRNPMLPFEPPRLGSRDGFPRATHLSRDDSRREEASRDREASRTTEQRRAEPARAPERAPAVREQSPATARPADARPQSPPQEPARAESQPAREKDN